MKISAGSADAGKPLCLYDENDDPIALMNAKIPFERLAPLTLEIVRRVNECEWQPIKTVPHGETVLLFDEDWEMTLGDIQIGHSNGKGGFVVPACDDFNPTHWMPLPDPPTV